MKEAWDFSKVLELEYWIYSSDPLLVGILKIILTEGLWALPAYTLKGVQMASKNHRYRHEFSGTFAKRFVVGLQEYHKSSHPEREEVLKLWKEKGFQLLVKQRGELKDDENMCKVRQCSLIEPHKHHVDGDADIHGVGNGRYNDLDEHTMIKGFLIR